MVCLRACMPLVQQPQACGLCCSHACNALPPSIPPLSLPADTAKAFLIILVTDTLLGYHSEEGWTAAAQLFTQHYGFHPSVSAGVGMGRVGGDGRRRDLQEPIRGKWGRSTGKSLPMDARKGGGTCIA